MTTTRYRAPQCGALYVEAAIIMPVLLLVTFSSVFFFFLAARHFSLQMLANDIAKDVSLALDPRNDAQAGAQRSCVENECKYTTPAFDTKLNLTTFIQDRYGSTNSCWNVCARQQYLLATPPSGQSQGQGAWLTVTLTPYPKLGWFDTNPGGNQAIDSVAVGDYVEVQLSYPSRAILGGGIAMIGLVPNFTIVGTAIAVLERPGSEALEG